MNLALTRSLLRGTKGAAESTALWWIVRSSMSCSSAGIPARTENISGDSPEKARPKRTSVRQDLNRKGEGSLPSPSHVRDDDIDVLRSSSDRRGCVAVRTVRSRLSRSVKVVPNLRTAFVSSRRVDFQGEAMRAHVLLEVLRLVLSLRELFRHAIRVLVHLGQPLLDEQHRNVVGPKEHLADESPRLVRRLDEHLDVLLHALARHELGRLDPERLGLFSGVASGAGSADAREDEGELDVLLGNEDLQRNWGVGGVSESRGWGGGCEP